MTSVLEDASRKYLPWYPRGEDTHSRVKSMKIDCIFFGLATTAWVVIGGGLIMPILAGDECDWNILEGMYFSYITISTIGLGDMVYTIEGTRFFGVLFVLGGLALFATFLDSTARLLTAFATWLRFQPTRVLLDFGMDQKAELDDYTDDELLVANTILSVINAEKSTNIEPPQLRQMLYLLGVEIDLDVEYRINELLYVYDPTCSNNGIDEKTWFRIMKPVLTHRGRINASHRELRDLCWALLALVLMLVIGGVVFRALEHPYEEASLDKWSHLIESHKGHLNVAQQQELSSMVEHLVGDNICSIPVCLTYKTNNPDIFSCETYETNWGNIDSTIFFSFTLVTTIGFGSFTPSTSMGKLFAVVYSFFGIILTAYTINQILVMPRMLRTILCIPTESLPTEARCQRHRNQKGNTNSNYNQAASIRIIVNLIKMEAAEELRGEQLDHDKNPSDNMDKYSTKSNGEKASRSETSSGQMLGQQKGYYCLCYPQLLCKNVLEFYKKKAEIINGMMFFSIFFLAAGEIYRYSTNTEMTAGEAFYFMFISCTTIGLGDFVPHSGAYEVRFRCRKEQWNYFSY